MLNLYNNFSGDFIAGMPLLDQTAAMKPQIDHLADIAIAALEYPTYALLNCDSVHVDAGGEFIYHTNLVTSSSEDAARITVGEYRKGIANGQRETTVAIQGNIPKINTVQLSAAEARRIAAGLKHHID